jgi:predicted pyridoxine 5'-phosphate oxidase superfamily flavin-nucleotide-binding protein
MGVIRNDYNNNKYIKIRFIKSKVKNMGFKLQYYTLRVSKSVCVWARMVETNQMAYQNK